MSKLLKKYEELKKNDDKKTYLFRVGIFYNILNEDAKNVNEKIGLKITNLSPEIQKCGFPISQVDKYVDLLNKKGFQPILVDNLPNEMNIVDYTNNIELKKIYNNILNLDMNNTTYHQAFDMLLSIQEKIRNLKINT